MYLYCSLSLQLISMRKYLIFIAISLNYISAVHAQNLIQNVENALQYLQKGYIEDAFTMFKRSANTNNIYAQYYLAQCYENGIGTEIDLTQAFLMYRKVAERGFSIAMLDLARCYEKGIGVEHNSEKAHFWQSKFNSKNKDVNIPDMLALYNIGRTNSNAPDIDNSPLYYDNNLPVSTTDENKEQINLASAHKPTNNQTSTIQNCPESISPSDVDINIPIISKVNENTFAFIIANENYQDVAKVDNALNDGEIFSLYCQKSLGIPESNVHLIKDATLNNIRREINLIQQISTAYNGDASFIIYYAGHGIPDEKTHSSYILPVDGYPSDVTTCYSLDNLYSILGDLNCDKVVMFIDACFSGSVRGNGMLASARGIAIKSERCQPQGNTVVFSSSQGDETAYPYNEKKHGLFTYFLLKKLKDSRGNVSLGELVDYVTENVSKKSIVVNGKSQTPTANASEKILNKWSDWTL